MSETSTLERVFSCVRAAADKRGSDILVLDVRQQCSFTDYFLLVSGSSDRRVQTIAEAIIDSMKQQGIRPVGCEGLREGRWALVDYGDWVVHVFYEEVRSMFDLEGLWFDAERVKLPPDLTEDSRRATGGAPK